MRIWRGRNKDCHLVCTPSPRNSEMSYSALLCVVMSAKTITASIQPLTQKSGSHFNMLTTHMNKELVPAYISRNVYWTCSNWAPKLMSDWNSVCQLPFPQIAWCERLKVALFSCRLRHPCLYKAIKDHLYHSHHNRKTRSLASWLIKFSLYAFAVLEVSIAYMSWHSTRKRSFGLVLWISVWRPIFFIAC